MAFRNLGNSVRKRLKIATNPSFRIFNAEVKRFFSERGHVTPSTYEGLDADSVVLDLGGYHGNWASTMRDSYGCLVHVFEPHPAFASLIVDRFSDDSAVTVHDCAIGPYNGDIILSDEMDGSSACTTTDRTIRGRMVNATEMLEQIGAKDIAVAKINIEGGEYDLLQHLIATGAVQKIQTITVQFHYFVPKARAMRDQIRNDLAKTHRCAWSYDFVWEEWTRL